MATKKQMLLDHFKKYGSEIDVWMYRGIEVWRNNVISYTSIPPALYTSNSSIENEQHYKPTRYDRYIWKGASDAVLRLQQKG